MRANLQALAKVMRPISDERARELVRQSEMASGNSGDDFVACERDDRDEFLAGVERIEHARAPKVVFG